jgi:hypothetical protein
MNSSSDVVDVVAPVFGADLAGFLNFLYPEGDVVSLQRFSLVLRLNPDAVAVSAHIPPQTATVAHGSKELHHFLRDSMRVVQAAFDVAGDVETALSWFKGHRLPTFGNVTPYHLVAQGRSESLVSYLHSLEAGFAG